MSFLTNHEYKLAKSKSYDRQLIKLRKSGSFSRADNDELDNCIEILRLGQKLPAKYRDHKLVGFRTVHREFHFRPNLLVEYYYIDDKLILFLEEIGNHNRLF